MQDDLGDRMKSYEGVEAQRRLDTTFPVIARIDGRKFSKFTKPFKKPFDDRLTAAMDLTTARLVDQTHANMGYTQSDEITLIWHVDRSVNAEAQMLFDGRTQKLCSVLAGMATSYFMVAMMEGRTPDVLCHDRAQTHFPHFDCRVWTVPSEEEAANTLLWRYLDAKKNSVSVFTRQYVSHKKMQGLNAAQQLEAAYSNGAPNFNEAVSDGERHGRFFQKGKITRSLTERELECIPERHRPPAGSLVTRNEMRISAFPWHKISNPTDVLFRRKDPEYD